jgi:TolB-like protein/Flp pilus assembly protein TadD
VTEPSHAVFLSYASQDAEAAQKICEALRAAGIEVFFDQSELRGGDAWDQKIRHEIHDCALFIPMVSQHTQERLEGYFRHEWKLAIERTHHMAEQKPFLVPVVVDATGDREALVPDAFRAVQWTRLPGGETPRAFVERIKRLLSPELSPMSALPGAASGLSEPVRATWRSKPVLLAIIAVFPALAYFAADKFWIPQHATPETAARAGAPPTAFNPPPHSIAVLPFVNMSGDKDQEYFSDGLTEELLNSLVRIKELQVAARTSSFSFKGKDADIATIARKLNVGAVLEGSVRSGGHKIRVTAELTNAVTGFHLWSQTYDRQLSDVLQLQTDIANAVTSALKIALLGNIAQMIEMGGTHNPSAFDAYLHATNAYRRGDLDERGMQEALAGYSEAIHLDPGFAMAYADRSLVLDGLGRNYAAGAKRRDHYEKAQADARKAITLVPDLAVGHLALATILNSTLDFPGANSEYARALALAPGDAKVLRRYGQFEVLMGHSGVGLDALRRSVTLDPLNASNYFLLGEALVWARRPTEALISFNEAKALDPDDASVYGWLGYAYLIAQDFQNAKEACERTIESNRFHCLAIAYDGLGRHADAEAMLAKLTSVKRNSQGVFLAMIYAQRRDMDRALAALDQAVHERDPYLEYVKTNPFLDPLRQEPRFQAIERALKFPS